MNLKDIGISQLTKILTLIAICFAAYFHFDVTFAKVKNVDAQMQDVDEQIQLLAMNLEATQQKLDLNYTEQQLNSVDNQLLKLEAQFPDMSQAPQSVKDIHNKLLQSKERLNKKYDHLLR